MSIDQNRVVDFIGMDLIKNEIILTISDHLEWGVTDHLVKLQEKLNNYLSFIESGELYKAYPDAMNKTPVIAIVCKYAPDTQGEDFLNHAKNILSNIGFVLRWVNIELSE